MENNKNQSQLNKRAPKFNRFWIYGVIALFLIGLNIYNLGSASRETVSMNRLEEMVEERAIQKIVIVNQKIAHIYLKESVLNNAKYSDASQSNLDGGRYHYYCKIGSVDSFSEFLKETQNKEGVSREDWIYAIYETKQNSLVPILSWILPFIIVLAVWYKFWK
jgi:AFG3 family protein